MVIQLPTDSDVRGEAGIGDFQADGALGTVTLKTDLGAVRLAETGPLNVRNGAGEISVEGVSGSAEAHAGSSDIRIGAVDGTADVSASNGKVRVGVVTGPASLKVSNGSVSVDRRCPTSPPPAPTARCGSARSRAARCPPRPRTAPSRSASARAAPPGWS